MRPIEIVIEGFGPFPKKETIDFRRLDNGLFLVTGDTGAGKTTIFDAITFALYGEPSGNNRKSTMLRSDFASPEDDTRVTFSFLYGEKIYKVVRTPQYERKRKRGEGYTTQVGDAALWDCTDGDCVDSPVIVTGSLKVTDKITEIMGINREQFVNVSMIAQGEFLKLLLAKSGDRAGIFRDIFNTGIYRRLQIELKARTSKKNEELMVIKKSLFQYIDGAELDCNEELRELISNENVYVVDGFLNALEAQIALDNEDLKAERDALASLNKKLKKLLERKTKAQEAEKEYNQYIIKIKQSKEKILMLMPELDKAKNQLEKSENSLSEARQLRVKATVIDNSLGTYEVLDRLSDEHKKVEKQLKDQNNKLEDASGKEKECQLKMQEITRVRQQLQNEFDQIEDRKNRTVVLYEDMLDGFLRCQAGIMASRLEKNMPCPVCGSLDHPKKQRLTETVCTEEELNQIKKDIDRSKEELNLIKDKLVGNNLKLEGLDSEIKKYASLQQTLKEELINIQNHEVKLRTQIETGKQKLEFASFKEAERASEKCIFKAEKLEKEIDEAKKIEEKLNGDIKLLRELVTKDEEWLIRKEKKLLNLSELVSEEKLLQQEVNGRERLVQAINIRVNKNSLAKKNIESAYEQYKLSEKTWQVFDNLNFTANGGGYGKGKFDFESYVQAKYFEQVIGLANVRLGKMTHGRYELIRRTVADSKVSKTGLELDVIDNNTGKIRRGETLSGGEAFMASLSMALGMSDAIASNSGGIRMDSMFIDEGFGSLDSDSMENAMAILEQLGEECGSRRMVGIISHVEAIKNRIDNKIVVVRSVKGSKIIC